MNNQILSLETILDAYEEGIKAAYEDGIEAKCPYPSDTPTAKEWALGVDHSSNLKIKNARLRKLRLQLAVARGNHTTKQWMRLCAEFEFRCVRCGVKPTLLERDHIVPIYQRGTNGIENIQPLCKECNCSKGSESINWVQFRRNRGFGEMALTD